MAAAFPPSEKGGDPLEAPVRAILCVPVPKPEVGCIQGGQGEKVSSLSKASEASLGGRKNARSASHNELGGFGGVSPHYRAYLAPCAPRGGVWGGPSPPL